MAKMTTDELLGVFEEMTVLELKEFLDAFEEKFDANQRTAGIESITIAPNGRLKVNRVMLRINSKNILAVARGAIAKASLT